MEDILYHHSHESHINFNNLSYLLISHFLVDRKHILVLAFHLRLADVTFLYIILYTYFHLYLYNFYTLFNIYIISPQGILCTDPWSCWERKAKENLITAAYTSYTVVCF